MSKERIKMHRTPGDVGVHEMARMMNRTHPDKKRARSFRDMVLSRERAVLNERFRKRIDEGVREVQG